MSARQTITGRSPIDTLRNGHGLLLTEYEVASLSAALQGINAIATVLSEREIDAECTGDGLTFSPVLAIGLLAAMASCTELAQGIVGTGGVLGESAAFGSPAYAELEAARYRVRQANCKEGK